MGAETKPPPDTSLTPGFPTFKKYEVPKDPSGHEL
jgi:hypothetical protein